MFSSTNLFISILKLQISLKSDETKLNPFMNENNINNIREKYKSPKKSVNKTKVFSELIVLNKANPSKVDLCIRALSFPPNKRNQEMLNHILKQHVEIGRKKIIRHSLINFLVWVLLLLTKNLVIDKVDLQLRQRLRLERINLDSRL